MLYNEKLIGAEVINKQIQIIEDCKRKGIDSTKNSLMLTGMLEFVSKLGYNVIIDTDRHFVGLVKNKK